MISRRWASYLIQAVFAEGHKTVRPEIDPNLVRDHDDSLLDGHEAWLAKLPAPIVTDTISVSLVIAGAFHGRAVRIYPPFLIDSKSGNSAEFKGAWIPEGQSVVSHYVHPDGSAVVAPTAQWSLGPGTFMCEGLRIDHEVGADPESLMALLLENVAQQTDQWWLRGRGSPFHGPARIGSLLNRDYSLRQSLHRSGASEIRSPWHGVVSTQNPLGFERPMTKDVWLQSCRAALAGTRGDAGILSFHDAVGFYMASDDLHCITSLSLAFEILANKRRILDGKDPTEFRALIERSPLVSEGIRPRLKSLFIDRGHVAHGRAPHLAVPNGKETVEGYINAIRVVLHEYTKSLSSADRKIVTQLEIKRIRKAS